MTTAYRVNLALIPKVTWGKPVPGEFKLCLHNAITFDLIDSIDFQGPTDEESVRAVAAHQRSDGNMVVVSDHEGNATAAYIDGEKVA